MAKAVAFLLSDTARWITGITLIVDRGLLPRRQSKKSRLAKGDKILWKTANYYFQYQAHNIILELLG